MELDFDKIKRIRKIRSVKSDLSKEENILIKPILSDKKLIPLIYKTFTNIICKKSDEGIRSRPSSKILHIPIIISWF